MSFSSRTRSGNIVTPHNMSSTAAHASNQPQASSSSGSSVGSLSRSPPQTSTRAPSYKTVLLGDASVGKSSLVIRFVKNTFSDSMETTIGAAFFTQTLVTDGHSVKFEIWDTAGQERFSSLAPMYYRGAAAAIIVYDQSSSASFDRAQVWVQQLQLSGNPNIVIALAANKMDISSKQVDIMVARQYAEENGLLFIETSAKSGQNVQELFCMIARRLPDDPTTSQSAGVKTVKLTSENDVKKQSGFSLTNHFSCCM